MIDVDKILSLKRRINQIAEEIDSIIDGEPGLSEEESGILEDAYAHLDKADMELGKLT